MFYSTLIIQYTFFDVLYIDGFIIAVTSTAMARTLFGGALSAVIPLNAQDIR